MRVLLAFLLTMNTRVLLSSMFLTAASLLRGNLMTAYLSKVFCFLTALRMFLGFLFWERVLGSLKVTLVQTLAFLTVF